MGLHYSFVDDESYGTEDINNITGELTGAGIAPFPTKDSYSTSDLNGLTSALVGSGTSLDGCKCTYSAESGTVTVAQGIIFFGNGTRLRVDADGYSVGVTDGAAGYVYAVCNTAVQTAEIKFAAALPISGDYVALCELTADGNIYDKRVFARSKVATFGTNATMQADRVVRYARGTRRRSHNRHCDIGHIKIQLCGGAVSEARLIGEEKRSFQS